MLAVFLETHRLRISDAERDQGVSRKPFWNAIRDSRIASTPADQNNSLAPPIQASGLRTAPSPNLNVASERQIVA